MMTLLDSRDQEYLYFWSLITYLLPFKDEFGQKKNNWSFPNIELQSCISGCDVNISACEEGPGICTHLLTIASVLLIMVTFPLSLLFTVKVVQEYERAVIFRLGRLLSGGASGPGVFFVIPCMDIYVKIDMRTATYEIPPQEVD